MTDSATTDVARASIQEITDAADIGFGSFHNHFEGKEQLFQTASQEVLGRWGVMIDRACAGISDPCRDLCCVTADQRSPRAAARPGRFLVGAELDVLDRPVGLTPRALRDKKAGQAAGGSRPARRRGAQRGRRRPAGIAERALWHPDEVDETSVDDLARARLRLLGMLTPAADPVRKVSIIPRGQALG